MFRFRSIESLLYGFQELEKQEIYFASPKELNDPIEGLKDIYWDGDKIVWRNLIINYIKSVENTFSLYQILESTDDINKFEILVNPHLRTNLTNQHKQLIDQVIEKVFETKFLNELLSCFEASKLSIRRDEFISFLQIIHPFIINTLTEVYNENNLIRYDNLKSEMTEYENLLRKGGSFELLLKGRAKFKQKEIEQAFKFLRIISEEQRINMLISAKKFNISGNFPYLYQQFPEKYVETLGEMLFPKWYAASFSEDYKNSAVWGHYANSHTGVCLCFNTELIEGKKHLSFDTGIGFNGNLIKGSKPLLFRNIRYQNKHTEIDFFKSIGRMNIGELMHYWYTDKDGNKSKCCSHIDLNDDVWSEKYWDNFMESITTKLSEWEYEAEHRIIIHGDFYNYDMPESRKLKYNFASLEGIIFGINTSDDDKLKIISIIGQKCKILQREDFNFYQAYYSKDKGKIERYKFNNIKIN
jgi:hypothetical protein